MIEGASEAEVSPRRTECTVSGRGGRLAHVWEPCSLNKREEEGTLASFWLVRQAKSSADTWTIPPEIKFMPCVKRYASRECRPGWKTSRLGLPPPYGNMKHGNTPCDHVATEVKGDFDDSSRFSFHG